MTEKRRGGSKHESKNCDEEKRCKSTFHLSPETELEFDCQHFQGWKKKKSVSFLTPRIKAMVSF